MFSNRLKGGPGEPKRFVCGICQMQYLVEKLNYRDIRGEQTVYLHFFPYSFLPAPLLQALRAEIRRIKSQDPLAGALRLNDGLEVLAQIREDKPVRLSFTSRTKEDKAQPYGLYLPSYSETTGSVLTFPINPPGDNDTRKFLFVLQHALLLQHHFGCKVLISTSAIPPLERDAFGDVFFDLTPLSSRGLIRQQDYRAYEPDSGRKGNLWNLWEQVGRLGTLRRQLVTAKDDPLADLVAALADHPLRIFYVAEKLVEKRVGDQASGPGWLMHTIADDVRALAKARGDNEMSKLDTQLERLAEIAWRGSLRRPGSWKKNSLMTPLDEVLTKLQRMGPELNEATIRAAAAQDMLEHIQRIRETTGYKTGAATAEACREFVHVFFDDVYNDTYQGKLARLLNDEKILRSAFHFYISQQSRQNKKADDVADAEEDDIAAEEAATE
jgi:CRISPR-associated protein Csc3